MRRNRVDMYGSEEVFIVPYQNTEHIPVGFSKEASTKNLWDQFDKIGKFVYRNDCEGINLFQQIIPYVIICAPDNRYLVEVYTNKLTKEVKMSMGLSTHITREDITSNKSILFQGALKIVCTNVSLNNISNPLKIVGTVRDMKKTISDHLGIAMVMSIADEKELNYSIIEDPHKKMEYVYMNTDELIEKYGKFESWSKHIINYMVDDKIN